MHTFKLKRLQNSKGARKGWSVTNNLLFYHKILLQILYRSVSNQYPCYKKSQEVLKDKSKVNFAMNQHIEVQTIILHCRNMVLMHTFRFSQFSEIIAVTITIFICLNKHGRKWKSKWDRSSKGGERGWGNGEERRPCELIGV